MRDELLVQPTIAHRRPKANGLVELSIQELARTAMEKDLVVRADTSRDRGSRSS